MAEPEKTPDSGTDSNNEKKERLKRIYERKLAAASDPDSIFILPVGRESVYPLRKRVLLADRIIAKTRQMVGFSLTIEEAKEIAGKYETLSKEMWAFIHKHIPRLYTIEPQRWRDLNDTKDAKTIIANRYLSFVIVPRSEEVGQVSMAVKVIEKHKITLQNSAAMDDLVAFASTYKELMNSFDEALIVTSGKVSVTDNYLTELVKSKQASE